MVYFEPMKHARLGNWLFQYAVAASAGDGHVATLDTLYSREAKVRYADFLHDLELVDRFPDHALRFVEDRRKYIKIPACGKDRCLVLNGYFQQEKYLDRSKFKRSFSIPKDKMNRYQLQFGDWLSRPKVTSIHVRRGDYLRLAHCHPFVGEQYFKNCLERLSEVQDFMVFSDDMAWCKSFFSKTFRNRCFNFVEGTDLLDDIHLQSLCQNNIISNSSFSWWGAYLNEHAAKRVLAPSNWFGFYLKIQGITGQGMFYEGMEIVPVSIPLSSHVGAVMDMLRETPKNLAATIYHCLKRS